MFFINFYCFLFFGETFFVLLYIVQIFFCLFLSIFSFCFNEKSLRIYYYQIRRLFKLNILFYCSLELFPKYQHLFNIIKQYWRIIFYIAPFRRDCNHGCYCKRCYGKTNHYYCYISFNAFLSRLGIHDKNHIYNRKKEHPGIINRISK